MRKLGCALALSVLTCGIVAAQEVQQKTKSKISVEDGKNVTVTGCVQRGLDGAFTLTNVAGKDGSLPGYVLAINGDDDVEKYLGHRVEVSGKAADKGKGKITVETKNEIKDADGDKSKTESKSEVKGDLKGLPYLGVKSMRSIATVCP